MGENTLMARVSKSKYYPRCSFLEANKGFQSSYAWRSLKNTNEVMELGTRWTIGNGQKVGIWTDRWLSKQSNFRVWSPVTTLNQDAKVCELRDQDTKSWKRDLVFSVFNQFEVQQIINIPISLILPEDKIIWHWEKDGEYSVRSIYHLMCENNNRDNAESSNEKNQKVWKAIWKVLVPNCVRNFLWRLARKSFPLEVI